MKRFDAIFLSFITLVLIGGFNWMVSHVDDKATLARVQQASAVPSNTSVRIFVPVIKKDPTLTPSRTPEPTSTPEPTPTMTLFYPTQIVNGGFESGPETWAQGPRSAAHIEISTTAHSGTWHAALRPGIGDAARYASIYQPISLTGEKQYLSFWYKIESNSDVCGRTGESVNLATVDYSSFYVSDFRIATFDICTTTDTKGQWKRHILEIGQPYGPNGGIRFEINATDGSRNVFYIDDVELVAAP